MRQAAGLTQLCDAGHGLGGAGDPGRIAGGVTRRERAEHRAAKAADHSCGTRGQPLHRLHG